MKCETDIFHGMLTIEITDGNWRMWDVRLTIIYEPDGQMMNNIVSIHAGERYHGVIHLRI